MALWIGWRFGSSWGSDDELLQLVWGVPATKFTGHLQLFSRESIPEFIGSFKRFYGVFESYELLGLGGNYFADSIPDHAFGDMEFLESLYLDYIFTDRIPKSFWNLTHLRILTLRYNYQLNEPIAELFQGLLKDSGKSLQILDLSESEFTGELPADINTRFTSLRELSAHDNQLNGSNFRIPSGELPSSLQNCTLLSVVDFGGNKFTGRIPSWIWGSLTNLLIVSLRHNKFYGDVPSGQKSATATVTIAADRRRLRAVGRYDQSWLPSPSTAVGVIELLVFGLGWWALFSKHGIPASLENGYCMLSSQFRMFTYAELEKATKNFKVELGRGGSGAVYKGVLADDRAVAVKKLGDEFHGEEQFWAEMTTIGKINHMNLVRMWGFCAERKHRLLPITSKVDVYGYGVVILEMVKGSRLSSWASEESELHQEAPDLKQFVWAMKSKVELADESWVEDIVDKRLEGKFSRRQAKTLIKVGVSCVEEDRNMRPTMASVVQTLLECEDEATI
nr:putative receptor protein kinase ZmPK1 [Ipomoea batatas]